MAANAQTASTLPTAALPSTIPSSETDRAGAAPCHFAAGSIAHVWAWITEKLREPAGRQARPVDRQPAGVVGPASPGPPDAVDPAVRPGCANASGRAVLYIPRSGVDHEQAAIGVFQYVGGVEVGVIGRQELGVFALERGSVWYEHVAADPPCVMLGREQISPVCGGENVAPIANEAAEGDGRESGDGRQEFARDGLGSSFVRDVGIEAAVDEVNQGVAESSRRHLEPVVGPDRVAAGQEGNLDQVHEPAANDLRSRAIRPAADEGAALALKMRTLAGREPIPVRHAHRHVEESVGSEDEAVETAVVGVAEAGKDHGPAVGAAVAVAVLESDQVGRVGDVEPAVAPGQSHREDQSIGKDA